MLGWLCRTLLRLSLLSPGNGSIVAVDEAQAGFAVTALDAIDNERDAFFDGEAGGSASHIRAHPTGCYEEHGATVALVTGREAFHQHVKGRLAGTVELPEAGVASNAPQFGGHHGEHAARGDQTFE